MCDVWVLPFVMNTNMSRRPSRDDSDQDLRWFHGKITRQEAEALLTSGKKTFDNGQLHSTKYVIFRGGC